MSRLIDADALKDTLLTYFSLEDGGTAMQIAAIRAANSAPTVELTDEAAIEHLQASGWMQKHDYEMSRPRWISVKDRLPENTNHVLALCEVRPFKKLYKCIAMYVRPHEISEGKYPEDDTCFDYDEVEDEYYLKPGWYEIGRNFGEYGAAVIEDFVTHWMPMPEPPEGKA